MRRFERLRRAGEIAFLRRKGLPWHGTTLAAFAAPPARDGAIRVGIVASKGVGGAVVRNRARRRIRGALEALGSPPPARMLFVVKPAAAAAPYARLAADVAAAVARAATAP